VSTTGLNAFERLCETRQRPVVTAEFPSFDGGTVDDIRRAAERLAPWVDAINVTDNPAAHAHASNTAVAIALSQLGYNPILQVVCRDKNRLAIQSDIVGVSMFGVQNICALTGDDVTAGDEPEARRVYDLDGPQLVKVATIMGTGRYLSGRSMTAPPHLFVGAVENPTAPPLDYRAARALKKVDAGARFLQLQICYQPAQLEAFMAACVANGVAERAAILPTVCLTKTGRGLTFMNDHVPGIVVPSATVQRVSTSDDPKEAAYQLVRELAEHALSLPGVAGLHITDFRHDDSVRRLTDDLAIGPRFEEQHAHSA
jgi:methylenetetrahydrofolate reductase (NADPH)